MPVYDLAILGGGPAGYAAALKAAERGAAVALIEAGKPGGSCVHHACIPTNALLGAAATRVDARELGIHGVFSVGEEFNFARAAARKDALIRRMSAGIEAALRMRGVTVIPGRASFTSPHMLAVATASGNEPLPAEAFIIATGTRWEAGSIPGVNPVAVITPDVVQGLPATPPSAVVVGGGPSEGAFACEYAALLAIAGAEAVLAEPGPRFLPALDPAVSVSARAMLEALGVRVFEGAALRGEGESIVISHSGGEATAPAGPVVIADPRRPFLTSLGLDAAGVVTESVIPVDRSCRTSVPHIYAAGDVTGGAMLSSAASHMGEVAAINATGGNAVARPGSIPHVLYGPPGIGWIGLTEDEARRRGHDVVSGVFGLSYNARAIALGAREGLVKVVAERELGEVLGVHAAGPSVSEIMAVATAVMQAEATVYDLAAMVHWHPSVAEGLAEAARRAIGPPAGE